MFFRKKKPQPAKTQTQQTFKWTVEDDQINIQLLEQDEPLAIEQWTKRSNKQSFAGVSFLLGEVE